jgi:hypothetical protein
MSVISAQEYDQLQHDAGLLYASAGACGPPPAPNPHWIAQEPVVVAAAAPTPTATDAEAPDWLLPPER